MKNYRSSGWFENKSQPNGKIKTLYRWRENGQVKALAVPLELKKEIESLKKRKVSVQAIKEVIYLSELAE